jgi:hypothetical protein
VLQLGIAQQAEIDSARGQRVGQVVQTVQVTGGIFAKLAQQVVN